MAVLLDKVAYFADEHLSENIDVTPEGYLICRNAVIGRTGFQDYKVSEIADPEGLLTAEQRSDSEAKIPLWRDAAATLPNVQPGLLERLAECFGFSVSAEQLMAYCCALLGGRSYVSRFLEQLRTPGPRVPPIRSRSVS